MSDARPSLAALVTRLSGADGLAGTHNTFARRHAVAEIAGEFVDGVSAAGLERATDRYLSDTSVKELGRTDAGEQRFTTTQLLACERSILEGTARRHDSMTAVLTNGCIDAAVAEAQPMLNTDQATAVRAIATSGNGVDTIQALAGTGKTTMMRTLADAYRRAGYHVYGTAPTARAARELRDVAGVPVEHHACPGTQARRPTPSPRRGAADRRGRDGRHADQRGDPPTRRASGRQGDRRRRQRPADQRPGRRLVRRPHPPAVRPGASRSPPPTRSGRTRGARGACTTAAPMSTSSTKASRSRSTPPNVTPSKQPSAPGFTHAPSSPARMS